MIITLEKFEEAKKYWLARLSGELSEVRLWADYPGKISSRFSNLDMKFDCDVTKNLIGICKDNDISIYVFLLAVFKILLYKMTYRQDIIVSSPVFKSNDYNDFIVLRDVIYPGMTFKDFLMAVTRTVVDGIKNQYYPFRKIIDLLGIKNSFSPFRAILLLENIHGTGAIADISAEFKTDIIFSIRKEADSLTGKITYNSASFKKETIQKSVDYYLYILSRVSHNTGIKIADIDLVREEEKERILCEFNDTRSDFPGHITVQQWFENQVKKNPDNTAVVFENRQFTYGNLDKRANDLAGILLAEGVCPGTLLGLLVKPSPEMIVGMLGIVKAGGAYLPIDPQNPGEFIRFMLKDSDIKIVITQKDVGKDINLCRRIEIHNGRVTGAGKGGGKPEARPEDLFYLIYTSGSTGRPKGVLIRQAGFINLVVFHRKCFEEDENSRISQAAGLSFDAAAFEVWPCMLSGAALYIAGEQVRKNPVHMKDWLIRKRITLSFQPTIMAVMLLDEDWPEEGVALRDLRIAGDRLKHFPGKHYPFNVYNLYGPTESTVWTTWKKLESGRESEKYPYIGKPIDNQRVYIAGKNGELHPPGIPGELVISGEGLSIGYLNRVELSADKFADNPFETGEKIYKTGDIARLMPDGNIDFLGRADNQVKVRGFRIELGEIETRLAGHPGIKEAVVTSRENEGGEKYLCAYFVRMGDGGIKYTRPEKDSDKFFGVELRKYLSAELPHFMIPTYFVELDSMPFNANGKIDKRALPDPGTTGGDEYVPPGNLIEEKLVHIWHDILQVEKERIGVFSDFFELGGHSLSAAVLISAVEREFKVRIPLLEVFEMLSIRKLADFISAAPEETLSFIEAGEKREYYPVSYNQERLWLIDRIDPGNSFYNVSGKIEITHPVDEESVKAVLTRIAGRHESLRTGFKEVEDRPVQYVVEDVEISLRRIDLFSFNDEDKQEERKRVFARESTQPFVLSCIPLFRTVLVKCDRELYDLIFCIHHIVADGWSMEILKKEFTFLYDGTGSGQEKPMEPLKLQYKDFSIWQRNRVKVDELMRESAQSWRKKIAAGFPTLTLPVDFNREQSEGSGAGYRCFIHNRLKDLIKQAANRHRVTLFTVMFAVYLVLLSRLANQQEVLCSIISAGRGDISLMNVTGFFVNSILFKIRVNPDEPFTDFLARVNGDVLETLQHQAYPVEQIFNDLKKRYPAIQVSFNMLNIGENRETEELKSFSPYHSPAVRGVNFDLEPYITEYKNGIGINCSYKKNLFRPATIEFIMGEYIKLIDFFTAHPGKSYRDYRALRKKTIISKKKSI